jgi:hypothetical protein
MLPASGSRARVTVFAHRRARLKYALQANYALMHRLLTGVLAGIAASSPCAGCRRSRPAPGRCRSGKRRLCRDPRRAGLRAF